MTATRRLWEFRSCPDCEARTRLIWQRDGRVVFSRCVARACRSAPLAERERRLSAAAYRRLETAARRELATYDRWCARMESTPRTAGLRALRPSVTTRKAWQAVRAARTRPALQRRYVAFLDALKADIDDVAGLNQAPERPRWSDKWGSSTGRSWSAVSVPDVTFRPITSRRSSSRGLYTRAFLRGVHTIAIADAADLDEMRSTMIHKALHWVDAAAQIDDHGHGHAWRERLRKMERLFDPTAK